MALSEADVTRIAHLARLAINPQDVPDYLCQLTRILKLVEEMQRADTSGIVPMAHAQDVMLRLRPDVVTETDQHQSFQTVAPMVEAGLYLVPKVIE
ncbi:MAG: Asp-tRNA(Asn)/Glu-tRNA(Gln) amidotransferase subunit GatC [Burkholderiales bacterium]